MDNPDVTVIIPTFRREELVVRAVRSVLSQDGPSIEVLVIDDSPEQSARASVEQIDDERVRFIHHTPASGGRPARVRNFGIRDARGRYLYFLDDDDQIHDGALAALVEALDRAPDKAVAYGTVTCIGPNPAVSARINSWFEWAARTSRRIPRSSYRTVAVTMFRGTLVINSCCMIRTDVARLLGGYDDTIEVYEDVEFFTRAMRRYGHVFVDQPVLIYATGEHSIMNDLHGDESPVQRSYARMHSKYKQTYGRADYLLIQLIGKFLSGEHPPIPHR